MNTTDLVVALSNKEDIPAKDAKIFVCLLFNGMKEAPVDAFGILAVSRDGIWVKTEEPYFESAREIMGDPNVELTQELYQ